MKRIIIYLGISCLVLTGCTKTNTTNQSENTPTQQEPSDQTPSTSTTTFELEANSDDIASIIKRDSQRLSDMAKIRAALELFEHDNKIFPKSITPGQPLVSLDNSVTYMAKVPTNPSPRTDGECPNKDYEYSYDASVQDYLITFCLGQGISNYDKGINTATSAGVKMTKIIPKKVEETVPPSALNNSRDQKRVADIQQILLALELYYNDFSTYPKTIIPGEAIKSANDSTIYIAAVPSNPAPRTDKGCPDKDYTYTYISPSDFTLEYCLGMEVVGKVTAGTHLANPAGIK